MPRLIRFSIPNILFLSTTFLFLFFIGNNVHSPKNLSKSHMADCDYSKGPIQLIIREPQKIDPVVINPMLPPRPLCQSKDTDTPVLRAILIYFPTNQYGHFFPEIKWYYRSWVEMLQGQPSRWRTDFILYAYKFMDEFRTLGCVNRIRQNEHEPSTCRLFFYLPCQYRNEDKTKNNFEHAFDETREFSKLYNDSIEQMITIPNISDPMFFDPQRSQLLYEKLYDYFYTDSINILYEGYFTYKMYDFVLRTDSDGFVYRDFATYLPENCIYIAGQGGYTTDFNQRRLLRISRDMNYRTVNITEMGSTWLSSPYDALIVANFTLHCMLYLYDNEFTEPERRWKLNATLWPDWYFGVLLLYGQHIALNHLVATHQINITLGYELIDQPCTDDTVEFLQQHKRLHLHAWHTDEAFSKFAFKRDEYNESHLKKYRNDTTALGYSMRMALESKYMTLEDLARMLQNATVAERQH